MTQTLAEANIRVNGQDEPLVAATLAALLEEKAVDTGQRGIAVAVNGASCHARRGPRRRFSLATASRSCVPDRAVEENSTCPTP